MNALLEGWRDYPGLRRKFLNVVPSEWLALRD